MPVLWKFARGVLGASALVLASIPASAAEPATAVAVPPTPLPSERCAQLEAEIAALKARMREIGSAAVASSNAQAATQGALAGAAAAGAVLSQVVGIVGHVVTEGALKAQTGSANSALAATDQRMASATEINRKIAALTKDHKGGCPKEAKP